MWRIALKVAKGQNCYRREAISLSNRIGIDLDNPSNIEKMQSKVAESRKAHLQLRTQQEALKKKYLEDTGRHEQWHKEQMKYQYE